MFEMDEKRNEFGEVQLSLFPDDISNEDIGMSPTAFEGAEIARQFHHTLARLMANEADHE
jgi:hypothetical protein